MSGVAEGEVLIAKVGEEMIRGGVETPTAKVAAAGGKVGTLTATIGEEGTGDRVEVAAVMAV